MLRICDAGRSGGGLLSDKLWRTKRAGRQTVAHTGRLFAIVCRPSRTENATAAVVPCTRGKWAKALGVARLADGPTSWTSRSGDSGSFDERSSTSPRRTVLSARCYARLSNSGKNSPPGKRGRFGRPDRLRRSNRLRRSSRRVRLFDQRTACAARALGSAAPDALGCRPPHPAARRVQRARARRHRWPL